MPSRAFLSFLSSMSSATLIQDVSAPGTCGHLCIEQTPTPASPRPVQLLGPRWESLLRHRREPGEHGAEDESVF